MKFLVLMKPNPANNVQTRSKLNFKNVQMVYVINNELIHKYFKLHACMHIIAKKIFRISPNFLDMACLAKTRNSQF